MGEWRGRPGQQMSKGFEISGKTNICKENIILCLQQKLLTQREIPQIVVIF
jgi:hypothetical protein